MKTILFVGYLSFLYMALVVNGSETHQVSFQGSALSFL